MKFSISFLLAAIILIASLPASADWANALTTLPPAGTAVPMAFSTIENTDTFYFIPAESTTDSSWIIIPFGYAADICYDSDTTSATPGAGTGAVQVMFIPYLDDSCPSDQDDDAAQGVLLGATLDGVGAVSGTPNDCLRTIPGSMCIKINVSAATAAGDTSLVSVQIRKMK